MTRRTLFLAVIFLFASEGRAQKASAAVAEAPPAICASSADDAAIYSAAFSKVILKDRDDKRQIGLLSRPSTAYPPGMAAFTASETPDRKELLEAAATATK